MTSTMQAVEMTGTIDAGRHLHLDRDLPISGPTRVRVILLYPLDDDWQEQDWLRAGANNPVFQYLRDTSEDVYTLNDGILCSIHPSLTLRPLDLDWHRPCRFID